MKQSILIALLSTSVILLTPSLSFADNGHSHRGSKIKTHKHVTKTAKVKRVNHKHIKHDVVRHKAIGHNVIHHNNSHSKPSLTFTWSVGDPIVTYGNNYRPKKHYSKSRVKQIYNRIHRQTSRIQTGIHNGQLVKREARKLRNEQSHIKNMMANFNRDGRLNRHEIAKINGLLDAANVNIHHKMTNRLTRYSRPYNGHNKHKVYPKHNTYHYGYAQF